MNDKGISLYQFASIVGSLSLIKNQSITMSNQNNKVFFEMCSNINDCFTAKEKGNKLEDLVFFIINNTPIFEKCEEHKLTSSIPTNAFIANGRV